MKKVIFLISSILILSLILILRNFQTPPAENEESIERREPEISQKIAQDILENTSEIRLQDTSYRVGFAKVGKGRKLMLIPNFTQKRPSKDIVSEYACIRAINGGFYTTSYLPLGLFMVEQEIIGAVRKSELTNGFFWIDSAGKAYIAKALPEDWSNLPFILQTGPIVKLEGESIKLSIANDEAARRMFVGTDKMGNIFFFTVFDEKHSFNGPYLSKLPEVVEKIEEKLAIGLENVINLDGGSASAFYTEKLFIEELALVGSVLCERE